MFVGPDAMVDGFVEGDDKGAVGEGMGGDGAVHEQEVFVGEVFG